MNRLITQFLTMIAVLFGCTAQAEPSFDTNRFLFIDGPITRGTLAPVRQGIEKMVSESKKPITMVLSSPGGEVFSGMSLVNYMQSAKALGVEINCYVLDMAASMAFQILTQCTTRHALPTSFLLWHGVRTQLSPATVASARALADDLEQMDAIIRDQLYRSLSMDKEEIERHFQLETFWSGMQLKKADKQFMQLHDSYPEIIENLPKAIRSAKFNPFSFLFGDDSIESSLSTVRRDTGIWYILKSYDLTNGGK